MISTTAVTRGSTASRKATAQLIKSVHAYNAGLRPTFIAVQHFQVAPNSQRHFSSSPNGPAKIKEFFEKHPTEKVRKTHAAWPHPGTHYEHM
jgi:ubiquinol oxidase